MVGSGMRRRVVGALGGGYLMVQPAVQVLHGTQVWLLCFCGIQSIVAESKQGFPGGVCKQRSWGSSACGVLSFTIARLSCMLVQRSTTMRPGWTC